MNWDDLRFVLAVADAGSLAGAGRSLEITLSTALRRLDAIEAGLGTRLFERRRGGYMPTDAGELMVREARAMAPRVDEVKRQLLGRDLRMKGTVRFTTAFATVSYLLAQALADFTRAQPRIAVNVHESSVLLDLSQRQADVALRFSRQAPEHWVGRQLGVVQYRIYARRSTAGLPQTVHGLATLLEMPAWIEFGGPGSENRCSRWTQRHVPPDHVRLRVEAFGSMVALLRTGCGIGMLPSYVAAAEPELVPVSGPIEELAGTAWILTHPDLRRTARIQAFMRFVGDAVAQRIARASEEDRLAA
ncbi:MAG: LysR family transcriptional regulator [Pseudomonadota bacterium]|nr:LysR family transcriptional regulator [Pseudomonadota bacterium]